MILWVTFLFTVAKIIIVCAYAVGRKIHNEYKIKRGRVQLAGRVVLITGASSGIGQSLAHKFYECGCKVILAARRVGELERVRRDLLNSKISDGIQSIRPEIIQLDLEQMDQLAEKANEILSTSPQIDILINSAGVNILSDARTVSAEVDARVMNVNYLGPISFTKEFLPSMIERQQGTIVFVSSIVGRFAFPYISSYTASKHAVQAFADCLRAELSKDNIGVVVASPGFVKSDLIKNSFTGRGTVYGVSIPAVESGQQEYDCANDIFRGVLLGDKEIVPLRLIYMIWIRNLFPSIYFKIMHGSARAFEARNKGV